MFKIGYTLEGLRNAKGSKAKKCILEIRKGDPGFEEYISKVFDPYTKYHVKTVQAKEFGREPDAKFYRILEELTTLNGNNRAKKIVYDFVEIYGRFATLVINHTLDCGVGIKTVQKIFGPKLIPSFDVILAVEKAIKDIPLPALASIKFDGVRVVILKGPNDDKARFFTRSGREFRLDNLVDELPTDEEYMLDAELVYAGGAVEDRTTISGKVNSALAGTISSIDNSVLQIFDYMPYEEWENRSCRAEYRSRYSNLSRFESDNIKVVEQTTVHDVQSLERMYKSLIARGMEGLILRYAGDPYIWDRTDNMIKLKATEECVLVCHDVTPGTGMYEGMIGALVCKGLVNDIMVEVKVGSGLSKHDRAKNPAEFIGEYIEVDYNTIIDNSLFLPRFKRIKKSEVI